MSTGGWVRYYGVLFRRTIQVVIVLQRPVFGSIDSAGQGFEHLPRIQVGGWLGLNRNPVAFILLEGDCCSRIQCPAIVNSGKSLKHGFGSGKNDLIEPYHTTMPSARQCNSAFPYPRPQT